MLVYVGKHLAGITLEILIYWQILLVLMGNDLFLTVLLKVVLKDVSQLLKLLKVKVLCYCQGISRKVSYFPFASSFPSGVLPSLARWELNSSEKSGGGLGGVIIFIKYFCLF